MRVLHYSLGLPPYRTGGLTKYATDLMLKQKEEHNVSLLYPAEYSILGKKTRIKQESTYQGIKVFKMVNPLPVALLGGVGSPEKFMMHSKDNNFNLFLSNERPDVIHFHTLMGLPPDFIEEAKRKGIKTIFTTHDYYGICPRVNLLNHKNEICSDFNEGFSCVKCNFGRSYSIKQIVIMQSSAYRRFKENKLMKLIRKRKKESTAKKNSEVSSGLSTNSNYSSNYSQLNDSSEKKRQGVLYAELRSFYKNMLHKIDTIHFNSVVSKEVYSQHSISTGEVINITHGDIRDQRRIIPLDRAKVNLAFLGPMENYKGFGLLVSTLQSLAQRGVVNWHLHSHGDNKQFQEIYDSNFFSFHGKYEHSELKSIFSNINLLIVPSLWKETYGFIGLEALSFGIPVLVTNNVGFKDQLINGQNGFIVEVSELEKVLQSILENPIVLTEMNERIVNSSFEERLFHHHAVNINRLYQTQLTER
ncbi:glycosyltransferase [Paenibacillus sp. PDC88]|uniref:glycosyltransferase n=1 Tax=Paenibacillus sp. PDC88 TaxID=1884375 RepID=UPI00089540B1|nr:glycosyltransferase [Paenibacillus sp. PDC88]SDX31460.1 Glycosyl transferases group 1 [Paenibacillus sp. PDC88]